MDNSEKPDSSQDDVNSLETPDTVIEPGKGATTSTDASGSADNKQQAPAMRPPKFDLQTYVRSLVNRINIYLLLFIFILIIAGVILFITIQSSKNQAKKDATSTQQLTEDALKNLSSTEAKVGDPKQLLTIESDADFAGKILVRGSLDVAGAIKVGGALSLPGITVSGTSQFDQVTLNSLSVSGNEVIQGQLNVQKGLTVGGNGSFSGSLSAAVINTDKLVLNQDLQLNRHIAAGGTTPSISNGGALSGGSTVSINGSDTAGTVTVNFASAAVGIVANVTFAVKFAGNPHVVITPVCNGGCNPGAYVANRTTSGFAIGVANASSGTVSFDYIVLD